MASAHINDDLASKMTSMKIVVLWTVYLTPFTGLLSLGELKGDDKNPKKNLTEPAWNSGEQGHRDIKTL